MVGGGEDLRRDVHVGTGEGDQARWLWWRLEGWSVGDLVYATLVLCADISWGRMAVLMCVEMERLMIVWLTSLPVRQGVASFCHDRR